MKAAPLLIAAVLALAAASGARAADLGDKVPGHPDLTYFDLMKLVVTDLAPGDKTGAVGHHVVPFQHVAGKDVTADPGDTVTLASVEVLTIPGDASRVVLLADLGPSDGNVANAMVLALFSLGSKPRLLDVTEVGNDRFTGLREKALPLGGGAPLILIDSSHFNSNQAYLSTEMIFIRGDRFKLIDDIFTLNSRMCSYEQDQEPVFTTVKGPGPYREVRVRVTEKTKRTGEECNDEKPPKARARVFEGTYRWDARKRTFVTTSKALKALTDEDVKQF
jgi:hypothetical protein